MLTHETDETLYVGMNIDCSVTKVNDKAVNVLLNSGIEGFIFVKNLDDYVPRNQTPEQLGIRTNKILKCMVLDINKDKISVELSCKPSDLKGSKFDDSVKKDKYFYAEWEDGDVMEFEQSKKKHKKRNKKKINHPDYHDVDFREAEEMLKTKPDGFYIVRGSTKGPKHLAITWRVTTDIYQHIGIYNYNNIVDIEESKNPGSYIINEIEYSELDEVLNLFIEPMARRVKDLTTYRKFLTKDVFSLCSWISNQTKQTKRSSYGIGFCQEKPGYFWYFL